jgi:hypothetical protein
LISCDLQFHERFLKKRVSCISFTTYPYSIVKETAGVNALKTEQERLEGNACRTLLPGRFLSTSGDIDRDSLLIESGDAP